MLAIIHGGINNLTEAEFDKLRTSVKIAYAVDPKAVLPSLTDRFLELLKAETLPKAQALLGATVAGISLQSGTAVTLAPILTGGEGIQIWGKLLMKGPPFQALPEGPFDDAFDVNGRINKVDEFALLGHELQHTVQIIRDGTKDGSTFLVNYLKDFGDQFDKRVAAELAAGRVPKLGELRYQAYRGTMAEIEGHAVEDALKAVFKDPANRAKFDNICAKVYDPKVGLKSLAGNKDVADLRALLTKEYEKARLAEIKQWRLP